MGGDVTLLLARWNSGDVGALEELMPLVYAELRQLAAHFMLRERTDHTLQPTALVHEAYLRLAGVKSGHFNNRVHFYGAAAQAMRRILIDHARQRRAVRRGADPTLLTLDDVHNAGIDLRSDLLALNDALDRLATIAPRPAKVVELRYFGGMSIDEAAAFLQIAPVTVKRHWKTARAWLFRELSAAS
ncbi:MAG: sigma-70 family RNA polymerase sigma factor [Vicinamibacterales bacterium]